MDVTTVEGLLAGGARHGPAFTPGHPEQSVLVRTLKGEVAPRMPLGGLPLPEEKIAAISRWIEEFRPVPERPNDEAWNPFQPGVRPSPPEIALESWVRNSIDRFILSRLEAKGIDPAPEADRRLLMRRVYFNLIGNCPGTPASIRLRRPE